MALVDYSDSDSESEPRVEAQAAPKPAAAGGLKKPFQKIVDRGNPGKILINLPTATPTDETVSTGEPPAKRAKTGGGRFSAFSSFLPPPKTTGKPSTAQRASGKAAPRPGVHLKTSAERAFSREGYEEGEADGEFDEVPAASTPGLNLPPPKSTEQHAIPPERSLVDEVKLVGKPLMFKPLSVARKPGKKKASRPAADPQPVPRVGQKPTETATEAVGDAVAPRKKISLFSIPDEPTSSEALDAGGGAYEPMFDGKRESITADDGAGDGDGEALGGYASYEQTGPSLPVTTHTHPSQDRQSLDIIADDLNLSGAARRELFGRGATAKSAAKIVNFNIEQEYAHNEAVRAAGEQQAYNPVRAIAPGKHSLRQIVNAVQNQTTALEDSFAQNRNTQREAARRYGWK